jgi:GTP cyclohydrolase-4
VEDVHARVPPGTRLELRKVGVAGVRKPVNVQRPDRVITLSATFDVSVDLPASRKGSDLSRNAVLLAEIVDETLTRPVTSLETACSEIARELLVRHPYAQLSEVASRAEYFLRRGIAQDRRSYEDYTLFAESRAQREVSGLVSLSRAIGAEAVGMTACPCAMETCRERLAQEFPLLNDPSMKGLPIVTHNQRNRSRLTFELPPDIEVEADAIVDAIEAAQSSPTYAILKRGDEATVVLNAHRNPKFVEDVMRDLLKGLVQRFPELPDTVVARVETVSEESIHKYNVVAAHQVTLGELRRNAAA